MNKIVVATSDPHKDLDSTGETQTGIDSYSDMNAVEGIGGEERKTEGESQPTDRNTHPAFTQDICS
jgi:hypothetical protein